MVTFNVTVLNRPKIMRFPKIEDKKIKNNNNLICTKTIAKLFTIFRK